MKEINYEKLTSDHYNEVITLWLRTEGVGVGKGDDPDELNFFLNRNEHLSFIAKSDDQIIGTILCGHDGRRGYIYHLAVDKGFRCKGIGKKLVELSVKGLKDAGIGKCHLFVYNDNVNAQVFWSRIGWKERTDLVIMSGDISNKIQK
jgi:ribosomal protein S18 acetylase RimI-like enzyme